MNSKKILCIILVVPLSICLFAQNTRSDLERISLDYAERLISDGANLERLEKFSQNQAQNGAVYSKKNRALDETLQRVVQNLSDEDKAHLDDYSELNEIVRKPSKIKKNRALIAEKAEQFSGDEREDLYISNTVKNRRWFWNILPLPGFGIGSFAQGDVPGGLMQLAGLGLSGLFLAKGVNSHGSEEDTFMSAFACTFIATPFVIGTIRPAFFKRSRNAMLRESLSLNKKGKAIAQNTNEVQFSFAPIVNPVADQYGAVALIRF
ncbi:MAG: hypothetical protein IJ158_01720 [Treponema sp.]|nr:hypothetical protein [Treponema sp.]